MQCKQKEQACPRDMRVCNSELYWRGEVNGISFRRWRNTKSASSYLETVGVGLLFLQSPARKSGTPSCTDIHLIQCYKLGITVPMSLPVGAKCSCSTVSPVNASSHCVCLLPPEQNTTGSSVFPERRRNRPAGDATIVHITMNSLRMRKTVEAGGSRAGSTPLLWVIGLLKTLGVSSWTWQGLACTWYTGP